MSYGLSMSPKQYLKLVKMSNKKRLLVEGRTDKKIFETLLDALFKQVPQGLSRENVRVDTAETFIRGDTDMGPSNRERVEYICAKALNTSEAKKLVGFVDREFREFELGETLRDMLNGHQTIGRVVWSRGHSIENYGLDVHILRQSLRNHSGYYFEAEYFSKAFTLFENLLESTIRLACTYSLVAVEDGEIDALKHVIDWQLLEISSSEVVFNLVLFKQVLTMRNDFRAKAEHLIERLHIWQDRVNRADFSCVKWMCHGHIGFRFIRSVFSRCVVEACRQDNLPQRKVEAVLKKTISHASEDEIFYTCSLIWIYESLQNHYDYPKEALILLGLIVPNGRAVQTGYLTGS